jgi:NADH dehydrogenase FAD-containing subunit
VVPSHPDIFVVGDTAAVTDQPGIPGTAPPAKQMGRYVGRLIAARVAGGPSPPPGRKVQNAAELCGVGPTLKRPYDHKRVLYRIKRLLAARAQQSGR